MSNRNDSHAVPVNSVPFTTTIRVRDNCLCLHSQRAARAIARKFDEAFRPLDLKSGQFSILMSLNRPEPPTLGAVADLLGMDRDILIDAVPLWEWTQAEIEAALGIDGNPDRLRSDLNALA